MVPVWLVWVLIIVNVMLGAVSLGDWIRSARAGESYWRHVFWFSLACIGVAGGLFLFIL